MLRVLFKFVFAGAIVAWLLKSGRLDFSLVQRSLTEGYLWLLCILLICLQNLLGSLRWKKILDVKSSGPIPYLSSVRLTWIGLFFNSFLPGAVTGDIIKLLYARDLDRSLSKTFLLTSVLIDRALGMTGLLGILGIFSLVSYDKMTSLSPQVSYIVHINFLLFLAALCFISVIFLPQKRQEPLLNISEKLPLIGAKIRHTLEQIWLVGGQKKVVFQALLLSFMCQFISVLAFWTIASPFLAESIPLTLALSFIPLGFITVAIPISPAGLGVGHVAFATLFSYFGIEGGASLFNLYFLSLVFVNSLGFIPYILSGKKHSFSEANEEYEELTS